MGGPASSLEDIHVVPSRLLPYIAASRPMEAGVLFLFFFTNKTNRPVCMQPLSQERKLSNSFGTGTANIIFQYHHLRAVPALM